MRFLGYFFTVYLKLIHYLQYSRIRGYLGQDRGSKRANCSGHIDGRPTRVKNDIFSFSGDPAAKFGWIAIKINKHYACSAKHYL